MKKSNILLIWNVLGVRAAFKHPSGPMTHTHTGPLGLSFWTFELKFKILFYPDPDVCICLRQHWKQILVEPLPNPEFNY